MIIKNGDTSKKIMVLMVDATDFTTAETGATLTVTRSKNGSSFASWSGSVAEVANGIYALTPGSGDVDTNGGLAIHITASGCAPADILGQVVAFDPYSAYLGIGSNALQTAPSSGTWDETMAMIRSMAVGIFDWDGTTGDVTRLAHDGTTVLATLNYKDKDGNVLLPPAGVPARLE